ncbi:MAG: helix-turn-helix domain-containing protein [Candidatus Coproplasma sp.]
MSFADNLQYLRKKNKITQEDLAESLNVSRQSVSKWETGEAYPETDKLIILCDKFGVTLDELLRGDVTKEAEEITNEQEEKTEAVKEVGSEKQNCGACDRASCAGCDGHMHSKKTVIGAAISSATMTVCAIIYLCVGLTIGLWHPTWLVFLGGVLVCIWSGGLLEDESGKSKKEKIGGLTCGTIMVSSAIIFLSIGYICGIWHPTWIVFIIGGGICGVIGAITSKKQ